MKTEIEQILNDLENDINAISIDAHTGGYEDRENAIETLKKLKLKLLGIADVISSFSEDDCQQLMFYGKTKNNQVKIDDGSKHLDYFLLKAFAYMKDNTIFDTENATKMFWNRIKALANYR